MTLSVVIITLNEERSIGAVLESVRFADEVIVLDSGSTDHTVEICRSMGARVEIDRDWQGFGCQKNRVLALATGDWVLSLDADEIVSPLLREDIESVLQSPNDYAGWMIPRESRYCGHIMRHGGWWPDYVLRLFKRDQARFSDDYVHERLIPGPGRIGRLQYPLQHDTYESLEAVLQKVNRYSSEGALQAFQSGKRTSVAGAFAHAVWAFFRTYVLRLSFLDGAFGLMLAVSNAEATYYRYMKLWLLQRGHQSP